MDSLHLDLNTGTPYLRKTIATHSSASLIRSDTLPSTFIPTVQWIFDDVRKVVATIVHSVNTDRHSSIPAQADHRQHEQTCHQQSSGSAQHTPSCRLHVFPISIQQQRHFVATRSFL